MKNRVLPVITLVAFAFLLIFDFVMCFCIGAMKEEPSDAGGGVIFDPNSSDERPGGGQSVKGPTVAGFSQLTIPPDVDAIPIDLYNPDENNGLYYLTFEFRLADESEQGYEVLFKTGYLAPGKHIYQVNLSHGMSAGEYSGTLFIQPYRMQGPTSRLSETR